MFGGLDCYVVKAGIAVFVQRDADIVNLGNVVAKERAV